MILLIDNYDSFVFNLARYFERLGQETVVVRNDATSPQDVLALDPQAVVLSPGPCTPDDAGCTLDVVRQLHGQVPILGVCLGHQAIGQAFGGKIIRAAEPMHGRAWPIRHSGAGLFVGLADPLMGCRYHSLAVEPSSLPSCLTATAWTDDGTLMAIEHRELPVVGIQFHPESILTDCGYKLLAAFLHRAGAPLPDVLPTLAEELAEPAQAEFLLPERPVTF